MLRVFISSTRTRTTSQLKLRNLDSKHSSWQLCGSTCRNASRPHLCPFAPYCLTESGVASPGMSPSIKLTPCSRMVQKSREGFDVVYAQQRTRAGEMAVKRFVSRAGHEPTNRMAKRPRFACRTRLVVSIMSIGTETIAQ
jgi:hypothetical protein